MPRRASSTDSPSAHATYSVCPSGAAATASGDAPADHRPATVSVATSMTVTVCEAARPEPGPVSATNTRVPSGEAAMPCGLAPTVTLPVIRPRAVSSTDTSLAPELLT